MNMIRQHAMVVIALTIGGCHTSTEVPVTKVAPAPVMTASAAPSATSAFASKAAPCSAPEPKMDLSRLPLAIAAVAESQRDTSFTQVVVSGDRDVQAWLRCQLSPMRLEVVDAAVMPSQCLASVELGPKRPATHCGAMIRLYADETERADAKDDRDTHVLTKLASGHLQHLIVTAPSDHQRGLYEVPPLTASLTRRGMFPWFHGIQIVRVDGDSAEVRVIGYLHAWGRVSATNDIEPAISLTSTAWGAPKLIVKDRTLWATLSRHYQDTQLISGTVPLGHHYDYNEDHIGATIMSALGTCRRENIVTNAVVVLRGRLRVETSDSVTNPQGPRAVLEVDKLEAKLSPRSWVSTLNSQYVTALKTVTQAIERGAPWSRATATPLAQVQRSVRAVYGAPSALFEIDGLLTLLLDTANRGAKEEARDALQGRCRYIMAEGALAEALER